MPQKILAGRSDDPLLRGDLVKVKVDQVVLSRSAARIFTRATELRMKKAAVELAIAYDTHCVTAPGMTAVEQQELATVAASLTAANVLLARPGIGFPASVHLERFAAPARLAVTDDPRLCATGGAGMLSLLASPSQLAEALARGHIYVRPPRSVQVLLSGRIRPFVCIRDVAMELLRRDLGETIARIDREHSAPVVVEFAGPSARLLSVPDRAVLCSLATRVGAAGAVFVSDEKTEVYLRDQRRSKAHRALSPDAGAPCDDVVTVDLSAVDPLIMDEQGQVRPVRELDGKPVSQVVLGGDAGASLRDLLAAGALLKSKRVPPRLDFLLAPPSRQTLEVMAQSGTLVDLIATGARLVEPDGRLTTGELYPPPADGLSVRTYEPEPAAPAERRFIVASAETLAYAVATGSVGDPRSFKRPVRVTVPRSLPTDDVLVVRREKGKSAKPKGKSGETPAATPPIATFGGATWQGDETLIVVLGTDAPPMAPPADALSAPKRGRAGKGEASAGQAANDAPRPHARVLRNLEEVRWATSMASALRLPGLRAVVADYLPAGSVCVFAGLGVAALSADAAALETLAASPSVTLPALSGCADDGSLVAGVAEREVGLRWLAVGEERGWTSGGGAVTEPAAAE